MDGSYTFELGAFANGFAPTPANTASWATNWRPVARTTYNPTTQFFTDQYVIESNSSPFSTLEKGFIWGYSPLGGPREWILLTSNSWTWPAVGGLGFPVHWSVASSTPILGEVNATGVPFLLKMASVSSGNPPRTSPGAWLSQFFSSVELESPEVSGWLADPDGDGKTNLDEMALGTNPRVGDQNRIPNVVVVTSGTAPSTESYLQMDVTKQPDRPVSYQVEVSGDLVSWSNSTAPITSSLNRLLARDLIPLGPLKRRYMRLTFTLLE